MCACDRRRIKEVEILSSSERAGTYMGWGGVEISTTNNNINIQKAKFSRKSEAGKRKVKKKKKTL